MKKHWLLIIGLVLSASIIGFGNSAYNQTRAEQSTTDNSTSNKEVINVSNNNSEQVSEIPESATSKTNVVDIKSVSDENKSSAITAEQTPTQPSNQNAVIDNTNNAISHEPPQVPTSAPQPTDTPVPSNPNPPQEKQTVNLTIQNVGQYKIDYSIGDTAWNIMIRAQQKYGFIMKYQEYSFGMFITQLGNIPSEGTYYWALYYNGQSSMVGATDLQLQADDIVSWKYESWM